MVVICKQGKVFEKVKTGICGEVPSFHITDPKIAYTVVLRGFQNYESEEDKLELIIKVMESLKT